MERNIIKILKTIKSSIILLLGAFVALCVEFGIDTWLVVGVIMAIGCIFLSKFLIKDLENELA